MSEEKIYCGNAKIVKTTFGEIQKISMSKKDINTIVKHMKDNDLDWINLEMLPKKNVEQGKPTHYIKVDTWKPQTNSQISKPPENTEEIIETDDLPF